MHAVSSVMTLEDSFDAIKDDKTVMKFLGFFFFCSKSLIKSNGLISPANYS